MSEKSLSHFSPVLHFFSWGIEMQHWVEIGNFEGSSPWDQGQTIIKLGAKHVIYQKLANFLWKGYLCFKGTVMKIEKALINIIV